MKLTEKEKCLLGQLYDANYDAELIAERTKCKDLCFRYNQLLPSRIEERKQLLRELLGKTGKDFLIEQPFYCDYGYNINLGEKLLQQCELRHPGRSARYLWRQRVYCSQQRILYSRSSLGCAATEPGTGICQTHSCRQQCMDRCPRQRIARCHHRRQLRHRCRKCSNQRHSS